MHSVGTLLNFSYTLYSQSLPVPPTWPYGLHTVWLVGHGSSVPLDSWVVFGEWKIPNYHNLYDHDKELHSALKLAIGVYLKMIKMLVHNIVNWKIVKINALTLSYFRNIFHKLYSIFSDDIFTFSLIVPSLF